MKLLIDFVFTSYFLLIYGFRAMAYALKFHIMHEKRNGFFACPITFLFQDSGYFMISKMRNIIDDMFHVTYEVLQTEVPILSDFMEIIGTEIVSYVKCVIHPFDNQFFIKAFDINLEAKYGEFDISYGEVIDYMAEALRMTLASD